MGQTVEIAVAAVVAATFALALVGVVLWLDGRRRREQERRIAELSRDLGSRVEQALAEVKAAGRANGLSPKAAALAEIERRIAAGHSPSS